MTINAQRSDIERLIGASPVGDNMGLAFDRLTATVLVAGAGGDEVRLHREQTFGRVARTCSDRAAGSYARAFRRWKAALCKSGDVTLREAVATAPAIIGTGNASVVEFGLSLLPPWGMPVIAGSSLKGMCSSHAAKWGGPDWQRAHLGDRGTDGDLALEIFGGTCRDTGAAQNWAGTVAFLDGWWIPPLGSRWASPFSASSGGPAIGNIAPHDKTYRINSGDRRWPDGMEDPVPLEFLVLPSGTRFLIGVSGSSEARAVAVEILESALRIQGVGGKSAVGMGRFRLEPTVE